MTSSRPYLLRALYEWIADNGMTPHVLIDATQDGVHVPDHVIQDGKVVLNVAPSAVRDLEMDNELLTFVARFAGVTHAVSAPVGAVLAVYARENGKGMMFPSDEEASPPGDGADPDDVKRGRRGPHLKIIK